MFAITGLNVNNDGVILAQSDDVAILFFPDPAGIAVRCTAEGGGTKHIASAFTPSGGGFVAVGDDGALALYLPRTDADYRVKVLDSDRRRQIVYEEPMKILMLERAETVHGASDIQMKGKICFNADGTAFLDGGNNVWVIDYRYADEPRRPFVQPSWEMRAQSDEYRKKTEAAFETHIAFTEREKPRKKGLFARLFGKDR